MSRRWSCAVVLAAAALFGLPGVAAAQQPADIPSPAAACDEAQIDESKKVLVYSETAGFRHDSIPAGIQAVCAIAGPEGIAVDATENSALFTDETLAAYDAVVFLSTTGDPVAATEQAAFERYVRAGGGYAGIHAASDTECPHNGSDWQWYTQLVGACFKGHPANQDADVKVADQEHPSTAGLPSTWHRHDEWYGFTTNPRGKVHVLATLDERSYDEGPGDMGANDHPIAWCQRYDGGRSWYTGGGHTIESFAEPLFRQHLLGGIEWAAGAVDGDCGATVWESFQRVTLAKTAAEVGEPIGLAVLPDRGVLHTSRDGTVRYTNADGDTKVAAQIPVYSHDEDGLQTIALDPDFADNNWVYVYYAPPLSTPGGDAPADGTQAQFDAFKGRNHLSRFKWDPVAEVLQLGTEQKLLDVDQDRGICCHNGGDFAWDAQGNLYLSTGDDSNPFGEENQWAPVDERLNRNPAYDVQRTSANTNDLRGKVLRIKPDPAAATYTIPAGNLFAPGEMGTRPEIYAMGFRNPFRISVDKRTGYVYVGDYGPDGGDSPTRGQGGQVEFDIIKQPGNYGWPYCTGDNDAYFDFDFQTKVSGPRYDCAAPVNNSPRNTGKINLPPAQLPDIWYGNGGPWDEEMSPGGSESPMGGPVYNYDPANPSETKFPAYYDNHWFPYEWGRNWIKETALDPATGAVVDPNPFLDDPAFGWHQPMDMEFGPDGSLYVLDYGTGFFGGDANSALYRVDFVKGVRSPVARVAADKTSTSESTLTVQFSSAGSNDPDGGPITYAWEFGDGETSTDADPAHTYDAVGTYGAKLTVTDETGKTGTDNVTIVVGNAEPQITVSSPAEGGFFEFGDEVPFEAAVTDAEDGTIETGSPDCPRIQIDYLLGHDAHAHGLSEKTGCQGTIQTSLEAGHGGDANIFGVIAASYTDEGGQPGAGPLTAEQEIRIWPKLLQAEHFTDMRGIQTVADAGAGGGERVGYTDDPGTDGGVNYVAWDPVNFTGIDSLTLTASSGAAGGAVQVRLDDPGAGPLLGTINVPNTGAFENHRDFDLAITPPAGTHKLFLTFPTGGLDIDQVEFHGKGIATNGGPTAAFTTNTASGAAPLAVEFTNTSTDPENDPLTYAWDFGVPGAPAPTTEDASFTYVTPGTYTVTLTVKDAQNRTSTASRTITVAANCAGHDGNPDDEFDGTALNLCRWSKIVRPNPSLLSVAGGKLLLDTNLGTDMYGDSTNANNLVLQPAPTGGWEISTKVRLAHQGKDYEQAGLFVYGDDDNFAKLTYIKVPGGTGRQLEYMLQDNGTPVDGGAVDRVDIPANVGPELYLRVVSDTISLRAFWSLDGQQWSPAGRPRSLAAVGPDPHVGVAAFNGAGNGNKAEFDWFHVDDGGTGEPICQEPKYTADPGYRVLFDGSEASVADWKMAGPGGFTLTPDCTLESFGGLGMLYHEDTFEGPHTIKLEWMKPGDDNSGVFIGRWPDSPDPFTAVNSGYEVQIDSTDDPDSTTGAIYNFQAPDAAKRDPVLRPDGEWNTYEITVDAPKVIVRLNGVVINEFTSTDPARDLSGGRVGLQNHGNGDEVFFRRVQIKEHDTAAGGLPCEGTSSGFDDPFDGDALNGCRWDRTVRYDPATLHVSGGQLHIETSGTDIYGTSDTGTTNMVLQDAPAGDWTIQTKVSAPLAMCCQQAGLIAYKSDDDYVKLDAIAENDGRIRFEIRSEIGDVVQQPQPSTFIAKPAQQTYWLRIAKTGDSYAGSFSLDGVAWTALEAPVQNAALAQGAAVGVFALGVFQHAPLYAAFESFDVLGDEPEPGDGPTVQAFADPSSGSAPLTVNFSATGLDPDGGELTYRWVFEDGSAFGSSVSHTFQTPGTHTATVTVTDDEGDTASDEVTVTVGEPESEPPVIVEAGADRTSGQAPLDVLFHAVAEDPEGGPLTYVWEFGDASGGSALGDEAEHTYMSPGTFTAKVTVTDETGETASEEIVITVTNPPGNRAPSVEGAAVPASGKAPLDVRFTSNGTDPDGDTLTYAWDFGDGSDPVTGGTARHVYTQNGVHTATVTVTDRAGLSATDEVTITVGNPSGGQAPTVQAAGDPLSGTPPLKVNFSAAGSDPDGDSIMYVWSFGDGGQAGGTQVTHTYTQPGTYEATVTVTDVSGKTGTATVTVVVSAALRAAGEAPVVPKGALRTLSAPSLAAFRTRGLKVAATCATSGEATIAIRASKAAAKRLGLERRSLGRVTFACAAGETREVTIRPSTKARKAIKAARPKSLKITVALGPLTRTVNLKRV